MLHYLRSPFNAMLPDDYFLTLIKFQMSRFATEPNDFETREHLRKAIEETLKNEGCWFHMAICDTSNNTPEVIQKGHLVVYVVWQASSMSKDKNRYKLTAIPKKWSKDLMSQFSVAELLQLQAETEFIIEKNPENV